MTENDPRETDLFTRILAHAAAMATVPLTRTMDGRTLNAVLCGLWDLPETGFPWRCRDRAERFTLGRLAESGLVKVEGQTNSVRVKLPVPSILGTWAAAGGDVADLVALQRRVAILAESDATLTPWGARVVLGFHLVKSAGPWWKTASASAAAWGKYQDELQRIHGLLIPLLLAGCVRLYASGNQAFWAVAPAADAPDLAAIEPAAVEAIDAELWDAAFETAARVITANPPDAGNAIAPMLPASRWTDCEPARPARRKRREAAIEKN